VKRTEKNQFTGEIAPVAQGMNVMATAKYEEVLNCVLCSSGRGAHSFFESVPVGDGEIYYVLCQRCGLIFQSPRMSAGELDVYYLDGYRKFVQGSEQPIEKDIRVQKGRAVHLVEFAKSMLPKVNHTLDIGSSTGSLLLGLQEAYGCSGTGIEPGKAYREFSRANGLNIVGDLSELGKSERHSFDLITMAHVLEHLSDPVDYLKNLKLQWISSAGSLLLEVPNLFGHQTFERSHLFAFSPQSIVEMLHQTGFNVRKLWVHGKPRSLLIPLYISVLASPAADRATRAIRSSSSGIRWRRKRGMIWRRFVTKFAARWAWLPWPE